jgi:hypothetical protein
VFVICIFHPGESHSGIVDDCTRTSCSDILKRNNIPEFDFVWAESPSKGITITLQDKKQIQLLKEEPEVWALLIEGKSGSDPTDKNVTSILKIDQTYLLALDNSFFHTGIILCEQDGHFKSWWPDNYSLVDLIGYNKIQKSVYVLAAPKNTLGDYADVESLCCHGVVLKLDIKTMKPIEYLHLDNQEAVKKSKLNQQRCKR